MNRLRIRVLSIFAFALSILILVSSARAQGILVSPVTIDMPSGQMATTLTISNHSTDVAGMQVRSFGWTQDASGDKLSPTTSFDVSPPVFEVAAGGVQLVRLVLRQPATTTEDAYRVLIDQLPTPGMAGSVKLSVRFSIPVFVKPAAVVRSNLDVSVVGNSGGTQLVAINHGTSHDRLLNPALSAAGGILTLQSNTNYYVLAGSEQRWSISGRPAFLRPGASIHLTALSAEGRLDKTMSIAGQ